jgi:HEPN domain-containing protein
MTVPADEIRKKVRLWAALADDDLRVAQHTLDIADQCPYRLVAYHAQQCVEKYLKAYLVFSSVDFPFTHNITRLLELCAASSDWAEDLTDAEELTPFAIAARYPGEDEPVTRSEAQRAIEVTEHVRRTVRAALIAQDISLWPT